jgi:DNA-binding XRE family transcriptional regulator
VAGLEHEPVTHDHEAFLTRARRRRGFQEAYDALALEYQIARELVAARARAGLTQDAVAKRMGTTKSSISRLESAGKHTPSVGTLERYARAVGCELKIELVPRDP